MTDTNNNPDRHTPADVDRLLKLSAVMEMTGIGRTMIYRLIRRGDFPQPYKPGGASSRWSQREIVEWVAALGAARRRHPATREDAK